MTSSYEKRIVQAMLARAEALDHGDDQAAAAALVEATKVVDAMRKRRRQDARELRAEFETDEDIQLSKER